MYNDILDAVTRRLYEIFGSDITIYTDVVKQGLIEPCFFVGFLEPSEKTMIGNRYYRETGIYIQYLPGDISQLTRELNRMAEALMDGMEYIIVADGGKLRGTGRSARIDAEERALTFFVNYNMFIIKQKGKEELMKAIDIEKGMVK